MTKRTGYYVVDTFETRGDAPRYTRMSHSGVYFGCIGDIKIAVHQLLKPGRGLNDDFICASATDDNFRALLQKKAEFAATIQDPRPMLFEPKDIIFVGEGGKIKSRKID